jgi:hypothetical protein
MECKLSTTSTCIAKSLNIMVDSVDTAHYSVIIALSDTLTNLTALSSSLLITVDSLSSATDFSFTLSSYSTNKLKI